MKLPEELKDAINSPFFEDRYEAIVRDIDAAVAAFLETEYPLTRKPLQAAIKKLILARYGLEPK